MRRHMAYITDTDGHPDYKEKQVLSQNKPFPPTLEKGEERTLHLHNVESGESYEMKAISLGYHDFEDQEDYRNRMKDVIAEKLDEHGIDHNLGSGSSSESAEEGDAVSGR